MRTTKRGTTAINYSEDFADDSIEDSDNPRRQTGLRTAQQRRDPDANGEKAPEKELGKEIYEPVEVQGVWREWMGKPKRYLTERQLHTQSALPTTLVPIRIDLDVAPFRPEAALPTPSNARDFGIDENLPAYKQPEPTPQYRLKDSFLWNLHEALITPDQFARTFVEELDFPTSRKQAMIVEISNQIRQQLEEHSSTALHPLFQPNALPTAPPTAAPTPGPNPVSREMSSTPLQADTPSTSFLQPPKVNGHLPVSDPASPAPNGTATPGIAVSAQSLPADASVSSVLNPADSHRCILSISINLQNQLYTDKFEWSLLHPPGFAEIFAKQTCADIGLSGEWVPGMAHAIYEASLRLKKDMLDNGGSLAGVVGSGVNGWGELENEACEYHGTAESALGVGAGWRFDEDSLGADWEPKIEYLSKEEIEKREGDRERQIRRQRRETARFTTTIAPLQTHSSGMNDYFAGGLGSQQANGGGEDERMGRGERSKKKRRFRSLSPVGRDTPDTSGFAGSTLQLTEGERQYWVCSHCKVWGSAVWGVRDGPNGQKVCSDPIPLTIITITNSRSVTLHELRLSIRARQASPTLEFPSFPQRKEPRLSVTTPLQPKIILQHPRPNPPPSEANPIYQPPPPQPRQVTHLQSDIASFPAAATPQHHHQTPSQPTHQQQQHHQQQYHQPQHQLQTPRQQEINPSSHLYTGASAGGQGQISASTMADITNYAEPGEDLDWTKITEPRERKRLQNIINGRKYRERRLAAEGQGGSGGNYPGASGVGSYMSTGYGQRQSLQRAKMQLADGSGGGGSAGQSQSPGPGPGTPQPGQMMY
jgi:chromatin structure-remodeling complex subunit SFH1